MSDPAKFWNKVAEKYSKDVISDEVSYQKKLQISQEYLKPDMNCLEIGCGTGSTALIHAPFVKHILATDISDEMIKIARAKLAETEIKNLDFSVSSIDELDVEDGSLDVVFGLSILHLVEDRETVMRRVHKMLKPEGLFITSTSCIADKMNFIKYIAPVARFVGLMPYFDVFTHQQLKQDFANTGFELEVDWRPEKAMAVFMVAKKP